MTAAHITNTPLPDVWDRFTLGMLARTIARSQSVMPLLNPLAGAGGDDGPITDPDAIRTLAAGFGVKRG